MLVDIDIIMSVFIKNLNTKCLKIRGERPQLKVTLRFFFLFSLSLFVKIFEEEIQQSRDYMDTLEARHLNSFKNSFKGTL